MHKSSGIIPVGDMKKGIPRTVLLIAGVLIGVLLLVLGNMRSTAQETAAEAPSETADMEEYARALEERIRIFCEGVEGVGRASVAVSLESGYRRVYAQEDSSYVLVGSGASRGTVYLTDEPPRLGGIAVVCEGGSDPTVRQRLIGLLCAAYDIGANKIYIAQAQN